MRLIDKDALIEEIERTTFVTCELDNVFEAIENAPTIESRPKGEWIDNPPDSWICSNCGTHYEERLTCKAHNYCCVCGADMRGGE